MILLLAALFGLAIGSFLNVCIYRIPNRGNIVNPPSHCPTCKEPIRPYDNIPLFSYFLLGGKCRSCGTRISYRYPLVEAITGLGFALLVHRFGITLPALLYLIFFSALLILAFIDLEHQVIPDVITLPGIPLGLLLGLLLPEARLFSSAVGLALGGGIFYLVAFLSRGGMGGGDIKLAAMIGSFLGWQRLLLTIFLATLSGAVVGILLLALGLKGRKDPVPFGPFLALGATLSLLWGGRLIEWYGKLLH
jgi:leader peptidase (prepilin peptidase) / N-methyltransferase